MLTPQCARLSDHLAGTSESAGLTRQLRHASHSSVGIGRERCRRTRASLFVAGLLLTGCAVDSLAQKKHIPPGGNLGVVADERLAALRVAPTLSARLIRRLGRGTLVSIRRSRRNHEGILFSNIVVTRRTSGWVQSEALVRSSQNGDDLRLAHLISGPDEFERIARARIFLDTFARSPLRPKILLALGDAAEEAAVQLSREAARRFERRELPMNGAPQFSYYLNYNGLDRYNRQGVTFTFDREKKQFHYDGAAWREILRKYPGSPEAVEAQIRLEKLVTYIR